MGGNLGGYTVHVSKQGRCLNSPCVFLKTLGRLILKTDRMRSTV